MEVINRRSVSDNLYKYNPSAKEHDYIEITEWSNGDGWDIIINDRYFSLSFGELEAINYLTKVLEYGSSYNPAPSTSNHNNCGNS